MSYHGTFFLLCVLFVFKHKYQNISYLHNIALKLFSRITSFNKCVLSTDLKGLLPGSNDKIPMKMPYEH